MTVENPEGEKASARMIHEIESSECKVLKGLCVNGLTSNLALGAKAADRRLEVMNLAG